eukprot:jgi/Hompol1/1385/HPOL_000056-RA
MIDLIKQKDSYGFFLAPVDPKLVPDYLSIIKEPMDFGTMTTKVENNVYTSCEEFQRDFELVIRNAKTYNNKLTLYYKEAEKVHQAGLRIIRREAPLIGTREELEELARTERKSKDNHIYDGGQHLASLDSRRGRIKEELARDKPRDDGRKRYGKKIPHYIDLEEAMTAHLFSDGTLIRDKPWILRERKHPAFVPSLPPYPPPAVPEVSQTERFFMSQSSQPLHVLDALGIRIDEPETISWFDAKRTKPPPTIGWLDHFVLKTHGSHALKSFTNSIERFTAGLHPRAKQSVSAKLNHLTHGTHRIARAVHEMIISNAPLDDPLAELFETEFGPVDLGAMLEKAKREVTDTMQATELALLEHDGKDYSKLTQPAGNFIANADAFRTISALSAADLFSQNREDIEWLIENTL